MPNQRMRQLGGLAASVSALLLLAGPAPAQQIQLDEPVRAGGLTLFPSVSDPNHFYYVPDRARLARHENGLPQFSLLRYVQNVASGAGEAERDEGEGGGILHAVVELGVSDEQREEARRDLRRLRPGAELAGPVVFRSGKFGLTSNFADENGDLTERVVGIGAAPVLDGGRAAVSLRLTRLGAQLIWQSFQSATPDLTFQFEMEMAGYRAPMRAVLEADFERIYSHRNFNVAVATPLVASEIHETYDELVNSGAIQLEILGDSEKLQEMIDFAYRKIAEMMFQAAGGGTGLPDFSQLIAEQGGASLLDKATKRLADARKETRASNAKIREERRKLREQRAKRLLERHKTLTELLKSAKGADAAKVDPELLEIVRAEAAYVDVVAFSAHHDVESGFGVGGSGGLALEEDLPEEEALPEFSALAVYELRKTRRNDKYRLDLNQKLPDTQPLVFSENIGDLSRYLDDERVFRNVNLDDPLYKQREITVSLAGANADAFDKYITSVSVEMRKQHESGEETFDDLRIDRESFNEAGNSFKMLYGWKGDDDRRQWRSYEYRSMWSFFDGTVIEGPWQNASFGDISLAPPYLRRQVTLEALDPQSLAAAEVRAVIVTIFYDLAGKEQRVRSTLRPSAGPASAEVEFMLPRGEEIYAYEIQWLKPGNQMLSSGRQTSDSTVLFIDDIPEG